MASAVTNAATEAVARSTKRLPSRPIVMQPLRARWSPGLRHQEHLPRRRRTPGHTNIRKRLLIHTAGFNLGLLMLQLMGVGTPRGLQGRLIAIVTTLWALIGSLRGLVRGHERPAQRISLIELRWIAKIVAVHIDVREMAFTTAC
jgi:hypothetical protein